MRYLMVTVLGMWLACVSLAGAAIALMALMDRAHRWLWDDGRCACGLHRLDGVDRVDTPVARHGAGMCAPARELIP